MLSSLRRPSHLLGNIQLTSPVQAPPSFQPQLPQPTTTTSTSQPGSGLSGLLSSSKKPEPDLITRYKLQDRISSSDKGKEKERREETGRTGAGAGARGSWAATKDERQDILKRRRDEMILEARRKMMERDRERGGS